MTMHAHTIKPGQFEDLCGNNAIGIWLSKPVTAFGLPTNTFTNVTTPISANH
jgi:hypothetical protein